MTWMPPSAAAVSGVSSLAAWPGHVINRATPAVPATASAICGLGRRGIDDRVQVAQLESPLDEQYEGVMDVVPEDLDGRLEGERGRLAGRSAGAWHGPGAQSGAG
jgi:hypothetical protein